MRRFILSFSTLRGEGMEQISMFGRCWFISAAAKQTITILQNMNIWHQALLGRSQQTLIWLFEVQDDDFVPGCTKSRTSLTHFHKLFWCLGCHIQLAEYPFQILTFAILGGMWKVLVCKSRHSGGMEAHSVRLRQHLHRVKLQKLMVWSDVGGCLLLMQNCSNI